MMLVQDHPTRTASRIGGLAAGDVPVTERRPLGGNWILIVVGALLFLAGMRGPLLLFAGVSAEAKVVAVQESVIGGEYPQPGAVVRYAFTAADGTRVTGSYSLVSPVLADVPEVGDGVAVRYLPAWPVLETASGATALATSAAVCLLAGSALVLFGLRRPL